MDCINILSVIDSKVRQLRSIPKDDPGLRRRMEENYYQHIYNTVAIEGSTLSLSEVRHIIDTRCSVPGKSLQEYNEVIGVEAAMKYIDTTLISRTGGITVSDILDIHRLVYGYVDPVEGGRLRKVQVYVGRHIPPHANDVPRHMQEFDYWLNSEEALRLHPVVYAALTHYNLVDIHPFINGNGRTSRLLMNLVLMKASYPPILIRLEQRPEYFVALSMANNGGDLRPFLFFIAKCAEMTLDTLISTEHTVGLPAAGQDHACLACKETNPTHN